MAPWPTLFKTEENTCTCGYYHNNPILNSINIYSKLSYWFLLKIFSKTSGHNFGTTCMTNHLRVYLLIAVIIYFIHHILWGRRGFFRGRQICITLILFRLFSIYRFRRLITLYSPDLFRCTFFIVWPIFNREVILTLIYVLQHTAVWNNLLPEMLIKYRNQWTERTKVCNFISIGIDEQVSV